MTELHNLFYIQTLMIVRMVHVVMAAARMESTHMRVIAIEQAMKGSTVNKVILIDQVLMTDLAS